MDTILSGGLACGWAEMTPHAIDESWSKQGKHSLCSQHPLPTTYSTLFQCLRIYFQTPSRGCLVNTRLSCHSAASRETCGVRRVSRLKKHNGRQINHNRCHESKHPHSRSDSVPGTWPTCCVHGSRSGTDLIPPAIPLTTVTNACTTTRRATRASSTSFFYNPWKHGFWVGYGVTSSFATGSEFLSLCKIDTNCTTIQAPTSFSSPESLGGGW